METFSGVFPIIGKTRCALAGAVVFCFGLNAGVEAQEELLVAYSNSVVRASMPATPERLCRRLTPVRRDNTNLVWQVMNGSDYVLVASFMGQNTATNNYHIGTWGSVWNGRESWVTMVPELGDFCHDYVAAYPGSNLALRAKQLLGLNPTWNQSHVVEYYIDARFLARPSPDVEITDCESELDFSFTNQLVFPSGVNSAYHTWFTSRVAHVYQVASGPLGGDDVPWSRLGYTWDWAYTNENADDVGETIVGLSEFIIPAQFYTGSIPIYVVTVTNIEAYGALSPIPDAPDALAPTGSLSGEFTARWNPATRGAAYALDVARDADFTDFLPGYSNATVGTMLRWTVTDLPAGLYYYRVRAVAPSGASASSVTQQAQVAPARRSLLAWLVTLLD